MSLKDLKYAPRRTKLRLIFDDDVRQELEAARAAAKLLTDDSSIDSEGAAHRRLEDAEAAAEEAAVSFVFEAVPRAELAALIAACPPTPQQLEQWKDQDRNNPLIAIDPPEFDEDTFGPRFIAAALVEPETTEDEVVELWESGAWPDSIWAQLLQAANKANERAATLPT